MMNFLTICMLVILALSAIVEATGMIITSMEIKEELKNKEESENKE